MKPGVLLIVCGPSGVGKTSVSRRLLDDYERLGLSISHTTRAPRGDEVDGVDYRFLSADAFHQARESGAYAEWARVHGNYYGTPTAEIERAWEGGRDLLFDIDYQGAKQLKAHYPEESVAVLLMPPSMAELERRLRGRETDDEATIARRLEVARHELAQYELFDYLVVNDDFDETLVRLSAIYEAAHHRLSVMRPVVRELLGEVRK